MPTWIDDEGRLRERADDKHQFLRNIPLEFLDPWTSYDSWDAEIAIKLITIGYNLDIRAYWDEAKDFPYGSTGCDSAHAYVYVYQRGMSIAKSSIAAGPLKDPDTPANWLAWAKRKGYDVEHLEHPQIYAATPAPITTAIKEPSWKELAQSKAREFIAAEKKSDRYPNQLVIADRIAQEFRAAEPQIIGTGGKPLTGTYIKRQALRGISSEQGKQLSTKTRRGK